MQFNYNDILLTYVSLIWKHVIAILHTEVVCERTYTYYKTIRNLKQMSVQTCYIYIVSA